jgi:hypothetical protein
MLLKLRQGVLRAPGGCRSFEIDKHYVLKLEVRGQVDLDEGLVTPGTALDLGNMDPTEGESCHYLMERS